MWYGYLISFSFQIDVSFDCVDEWLKDPHTIIVCHIFTPNRQYKDFNVWIFNKYSRLFQKWSAIFNILSTSAYQLWYRGSHIVKVLKWELFLSLKLILSEIFDMVYDINWNRLQMKNIITHLTPLRESSFFEVMIVS